MVERSDPARAGVRAGRVVGVLTGALAVASLGTTRSSFYAATAPLLEAVGLGGGHAAALLFWGNVAVALSARYSACYVVGSLVGVLYDWLDRPPIASLFAVVLLVGCADGFLAALDTGSVTIGGLYVLAWLSFVPLFAWLFEDGAEDFHAGARRLRDM